MIIQNSKADGNQIVSGAASPGTVCPNEKYFATEHLLPDLKRRTISSGVITTIAQGIQFALNLVSIVVLGRLLTPHEFGLVAMVTTVMGFLRVFKDAGLSTATVQWEGITHGQVSNLFWMNVALSGAASLAVAVCAPLIAWYNHEPQLVGLTLALAGTFLLNGLTVQNMALLNRQMHFTTIAIIQVGSMTLGVAVGIGMAWFKYGCWALVGMNLTTAFSALLMTWFASGWRPQLPSRQSGTGSLLGFGANMAVGGFVYSLARGADGLLIGPIFGASAFGLYSRAGVLLTRPLEQFLTPINTVFVPVLSRLQTQPERYRRTFLQVYEAITLTSFLFTGSLLALARPITLVVLGPKWEEAAVIFAGFTIAAIFYPLSTVSSWLFASQGRGGDWMFASLLISAATVASFVGGLPWGPAGVAISYSVSGIVVMLPIIYYLGGRRGPVSTRDLWMGFFRYLPLWGIVCGTTFLMRAAVDFSPLSELLACAPVGLAAGLVSVWICPPWRRAAVSLIDAVKELRTSRKIVAEGK